jgi:hypothetical protein
VTAEILLAGWPADQRLRHRRHQLATFRVPNEPARQVVQTHSRS